MRLVALLVTMVVVSACGGGGNSPTAPTPATPTVTGQYTGTYRIDNCTETGAASGFCIAIGTGGGHVFTPQQSGSNLAGTMAVGGFNFPVSGSVGTDNVVALSGGGQLIPGANLSLSTWRGNLIGSTIAGSMQFVITTTDPFGSATVRGTFSITK